MDTVILNETYARMDDRPPDSAQTEYRCSLCGKRFIGLDLFDAHKVHPLNSPLRRCLVSDELRALVFRKRKDGVYTKGLLTSMHPAQSLRLATVRRETETGVPYVDEVIFGVSAASVTTRPTSENVPLQAIDPKARLQPRKKKSRRVKGRSKFTLRSLGVTE